jgi:hypothetical protein
MYPQKVYLLQIYPFVKKHVEKCESSHAAVSLPEGGVSGCGSIDTKDLVLKWAREHGDITFHGHKIKFYQDFSSSLVKKRVTFNDTKSTLYKTGISFGLTYPAVSVSPLTTKSIFSETHEEAEFFYRQCIY